MADSKSESTVDRLLVELEEEADAPSRAASVPPPVPGEITGADSAVMVLDDELVFDDDLLVEEADEHTDRAAMDRTMDGATMEAAAGVAVDSVEIGEVDDFEREEESAVIHPRGLEELGFVELETDVGPRNFELPSPDALDPASFVEAHADAAQDFIAECNERLQRTKDAREVARLHHRIGRAYELPMGELARAVHHFQLALEKAPTDVAVIQDTRRALLLTKKYAAALDLFEPEIRLCPDPREKAELLLEQGLLLRDRMARPDDARRLFENALELDGTNLAVLGALEHAYTTAGAHRELERVLERGANAVETGPHRAALIATRAAVVERSLDDPERAIALYEQAVQLDPRASGCLAALKRLYRSRQRWGDLVRMLQLDASLSETPQLKANRLFDAARMQLEHLGNQRDALLSLEEAAALAPDDPGILESLARLYERAGRFEELARTLRVRVQLATDNASRIALLGELATLHLHRLDDRAGAIHWREAAIAVDPLHGPSLQALESLYSAEGRRNDIIALRTQQAQGSTDTATRIEACTRIGVLEEEEGRIDRAIASHQRALALDAGHAASFKALVRLLAQERRYKDLVHLHERAADDADEAFEAIAHYFEMGALLEGPIGDPSLAIKPYNAILALSPGDRRALAALGRAAESAEDFSTVLRALDLEIEEASSDEQRVSLMHRAATVQETRLGDTSGAVIRLRRIQELEPAHAGALSDLARLFSNAGRWEELAEVLRQQLSHTKDKEERVERAFRLASIYKKQLGKEEEALAQLHEAFKLNAQHRPTALALLELLEARNEHEQAAKVLTTLADHANSSLEKARHLFRAGELQELRVRDSKGAAALYAKALQAFDYGPARDALERLRREAKDTRALTKGLAAVGVSGAEERDAVDALLREGAVWSASGDVRRAIERYEAAWAIAPTHLGVLLALEHAHRAASRWEALARTLAAKARVLEGRARIAAHHAEAQVRAAHRIGESDSLVDIYRSILAMDPEDAPAIRALEELAVRERDPALVAEVEELAFRRTQAVAAKAGHAVRLGEAYEALGMEHALGAFREALRLDPNDLAASRGMARLALSATPEVRVEACLQEARVAIDGPKAAGHLLEAAAIRLDRLGDVQGAATDLERALTQDPNSRDAATRLADALRPLNEPERLRDALTRAAGAAAPDRSAELWMDAARLMARDLGDRPAAINVLRRLLRSMPNHMPAMQQQAEYLCADGDYKDAVGLYDRIVRLATDTTTLRDTHLRLAALWDGQLGNTQRAVVSLQAVLAIEPTSLEGLTRLADIHEREGRIDEATELAQRLLIAATSGAPRAAGLLRLARLQRHQGLDAAASEALREAVSIEGPGSESALECKALAKSTAAWSQYLGALEAYLTTQELKERAPTYREMGRVLFDQLEQRSRAIDVLSAGVRETGDGVLAQDLALRLRSTGDLERAVDVLVGLASQDPFARELWRELAATHAHGEAHLAARIASEPLALLGNLTPQDSKRLQAAPARPAAARPGSLGEDLLDRLSSPSAGQKAASALFRMLEPALVKLYPPDFESYGLGSRDKLSSGRNPHPFRVVADEVAAIYGVSNFEVYLHDVRNRGMSIELGNTPAIIFPRSVSERPRAEQVFLLGRPLAHIARGFPAIPKLTPRELEVLLASAARNVQSGFGAGLTNEEILDEQAKRLYKALPRRSRKALEEVATDYVDAGRVDFARWVRGAERTAARAAALLSDDLAATARVLQQTERDLSAHSGEALLRHSDLLRDLTVFWASKAAMHLRQHMGVL